MPLTLIQDTVQQVARAITASLELETEIVDDTLMIVGGTGRYASKIGQYEEDGNLNAPYVYADCLKNGKEYINFNPESDPRYDAKENELAEICCPINIKDNTVGLIGLVAFTQAQRQRMMIKTSELTMFLRIMAELIAGKLILSQSNIHLQSTISSLLSGSDEGTSFDSIISVSGSMNEIKRRALQVAHSNSSILITGESGTGKGLLARSIHNASNRAGKPFVSVNCAAIPEMLLESELFGYEKGAFTGASASGKPGKFQLADKGTIFLDEIGDMPLHLQVKLLACLQNREVDPVGSVKPVSIDVRVITATNKNLEEMLAEKRFREDLYFRLNVIPLYIPPIRQRPEDIDVLIDYAIKKFSSRFNKNITNISAEARVLLKQYDWPGNVREIENVVEYAINMETSSKINVSALPEKVSGKSSKNHAAKEVVSAYDNEDSLKSQLADAERQIISECLNKNGRSLEGKQKTAAMLGISESTLYRRLRSLKI